jgi:hypothetical protein
MASSKSIASYNMLISFCNKLTCLKGVITPEAVDRLVDELGGIFTFAKTHHYEQGQKYGHLASTIPKPKYRLVIESVTWTHTIPADPGAYSMAALAVRNAATLQEQYRAEHKILMKSYNDYLGVKEAGKDLILYTAGSNALAPHKKTVHRLWRLNSTLDDQLSMPENCDQDDNSAEAQLQGHWIQHPWDPTTSITAYFTQLDRFQVSLGNCGIATSDAEKTMVAGAQMCQSEMFMEDQMVAWENKPAALQTWAELQTYFTEKWL